VYKECRITVTLTLELIRTKSSVAMASMPLMIICAVNGRKLCPEFLAFYVYDNALYRIAYNKMRSWRAVFSVAEFFVVTRHSCTDRYC